MGDTWLGGKDRKVLTLGPRIYLGLWADRQDGHELSLPTF